MGLGKSVQAITAADRIRAVRILIVCPAVACENWRNELRKFSPNRLVGIKQSRRDPFRYNTTIISYDLAADIGSRIDEDFDLLILDESHFLKNVEAQRTQRILGKGGIREKCRRIWCLTGTPMPNHPGELWPMLRTFGATTLSYDAFIKRYCKLAPGYRDHMRPVGRRPERDEELRALLSKVTLRRTAKDVGLELPPLTFGDLVVPPGEVDVTPEIQERVEEQEEWIAAQLQGETLDDRQMAILTACAQSVSTLRLYNGWQMIEPVSDIVQDELAAGAYSKIIIFVVHKSVAHGIVDNLWTWGAVSITGETGARERNHNIERFQNDPDCQIIVCNIRAAGTAINLTAADHVLFAEAEWSPADNRQAVKRAHRIGRERPVFVRFAGIAGSIHEKIQATIRRKTDDINAIIGD